MPNTSASSATDNRGQSFAVRMPRPAALAILTTVIGLVALTSGGCAGQRAQALVAGPGPSPRTGLASADHGMAALGTPTPMFAIAGLGAGDALGRAIYINDIILAAANRLREQKPTAVADAPIDE